MQYTVPKFLEMESKIAFGLTFKKLAVLGALFFIVFVLWYVIPRPIVVAVAIVFAGLFVAGAFVKIDGHSLPDLFGYLVKFVVSSKVFTWSRREQAAPIRFVKKKRVVENKEEATLKIAPESRLRSISSRIEIGNKPTE